MKSKSNRKSNTTLYRVRSNILTKCYNKNAPTYKNFGGKGITVCDEWKESFPAFEKWALDNGYKKGLSIKLIDKSKNFSPDNCEIVNSLGNKKTHGMSNSRPYHIRASMISRCHNKNFNSFEMYGAKGITVCDEWRESFKNFWEWASNNGYSDELTNDRIDPKGNYEPSNCRWITPHEQILNQERNKSRTINDRYITKSHNGKFKLTIFKSFNGKQKLALAQTLETMDEAVEARDYYLSTGKKLDLQKKDKEYFLKNETLNDKTIKNKRKIKKLREKMRNEKINIRELIKIAS